MPHVHERTPRLRAARVRVVGAIAALAIAHIVTPDAPGSDVLPIVFSPPVNVSNLVGLSQVAVISHDGDGTVFVVWEERSQERLLIARSEDGAATFTDPRPVVPGSENLSFGQARLASFGPDDIRMAFTSFDTLGGGAEIIYAASTDAGETFPGADVVSAIDGINSYAPDIALGQGVVVAWGNSNLFTGHTWIDVTVSEDDGDNVSFPKRADASLGTVCCPTVGVFGDDSFYVAWVQNDAPFSNLDAEEIMFARSADRGASFSVPINVSRNVEKSWPPRMAVDDAGTIYLVWPEGDFVIDMKLQPRAPTQTMTAT